MRAEEAEDPDGEVAKIAANLGLTMSREDINVAHRLPSRAAGPRPFVAKFIRLRTKSRHGQKESIEIGRWFETAQYLC